MTATPLFLVLVIIVAAAVVAAPSAKEELEADAGKLKTRTTVIALYR